MLTCSLDTFVGPSNTSAPQSDHIARLEQMISALEERVNKSERVQAEDKHKATTLKNELDDVAAQLKGSLERIAALEQLLVTTGQQSPDQSVTSSSKGKGRAIEMENEDLDVEFQAGYDYMPFKLMPLLSSTVIAPILH